MAQSAAFEVAGAVSSRDAMDAVDRLRPAAVLVDAAASDVLPLARRLKAEHPQMTLIGFGISCDDGSLACAEAGLTGFVGRDGTIADLVAAVKAALAGEVGCSPRLAALFCARLATLSGNPPTGNAQLTLREHQIAELAAQGLSNKEIAITLAIGPANRQEPCAQYSREAEPSPARRDWRPVAEHGCRVNSLASPPRAVLSDLGQTAVALGSDRKMVPRRGGIVAVLCI